MTIELRAIKRLAAVVTLAGVASQTLSGCLFATSTPVIAAQVASTAVLTGVSLSGQLPAVSTPSQAAAAGLTQQRLCIELNPPDAIPELIPAMQSRLHAYGITSMVYSPGTWPTGCTVLSYSVRRTWRNSMWGTGTTEYVAYATLTLTRNGNILNTVYYDSQRSSMDNWSSVSVKIAQLVDKLVVY